MLTSSLRNVLPLGPQFRKAAALSNQLSTPSNDAHSRQLLLFRDIWADCVNDVIYYKRLVSEGNAPKTINSWDDFRQIPKLERRILQDSPQEFRRISGAPDSYLSTGGSTGQPIRFGQWRSELAPVRIAKLVPWIRLGYTLNDPIFWIWGHAHLLGTGLQRHYNHTVRRAKDWLAGYHRVDAYSLSKEKAHRIARKIIQLKPAGLIGYAAVLDLFCRYTTEYHDDMRSAGLKFIMPCAEPPPRDDTFDLFRSVFSCPIVQEFAGVDFGHVGFKIDTDPYLLFPDLNILEVVSESPGVETGAAMVTSLYRRYVPLIRYRQGDIITGARVDQNGTVLSFAEQQGRINDMIQMQDGEMVYSAALIHCFKPEARVLNLQLVIGDSGPSFSVVVAEPLAVAAEKKIRHRLKQVNAQLESAPFQYVTDLATNRAGKRRWVVDRRQNGGHTDSGS